MFGPEGPSFWELARQALSSTRRGYDLLARKFDHTPFRTPAEVLAICASRMEPVENGLDLCCGTGAGLEAIAPYCQKLTGLDFSAGMLEVARERFPQARLVQQDVLRMDFEEEFDLVTCFGAFGHILPEQEPRFVHQIARSLRPGGRFLFVTGYRPSPWRRWRSWLFNSAMWLRNLVWKPEFVMYYLTFMLPECRGMLEAHGLSVREMPGLFEGDFKGLVVVEARKGS